MSTRVFCLDFLFPVWISILFSSGWAEALPIQEVPPPPQDAAAQGSRSFTLDFPFSSGWSEAQALEGSVKAELLKILRGLDPRWGSVESNSSLGQLRVLYSWKGSPASSASPEDFHRWATTIRAQLQYDGIIPIEPVPEGFSATAPPEPSPVADMAASVYLAKLAVVPVPRAEKGSKPGCLLLHPVSALPFKLLLPSADASGPSPGSGFPLPADSFLTTFGRITSRLRAIRWHESVDWTRIASFGCKPGELSAAAVSSLLEPLGYDDLNSDLKRFWSAAEKRVWALFLEGRLAGPVTVQAIAPLDDAKCTAAFAEQPQQARYSHAYQWRSADCRDDAKPQGCLEVEAQSFQDPPVTKPGAYRLWVRRADPLEAEESATRWSCFSVDFTLAGEANGRDCRCSEQE